MKVIKLKDNVYQIDFKTREELLKTFIRFQEYYESPEFKHKVFTVDEYAKWYVKAFKKESFSYYTDWSGCNVPSYVFHDFRTDKMLPLSERETALLELLPKDGDFYVIGSFAGGRPDVIEHELCHGLFHSNEDYKNDVLSEISRHDVSEVRKHIEKLGYHPDVVSDEIHAYISASHEELKKKSVLYPEDLRVNLNSLREKHS